MESVCNFPTTCQCCIKFALSACLFLSLALSLLFSLSALLFFSSFTQLSFSRMAPPCKLGPAQGFFLLKGTFSLPLLTWRPRSLALAVLWCCCAVLVCLLTHATFLFPPSIRFSLGVFDLDNKWCLPLLIVVRTSGPYQAPGGTF